VSRHVLVFGHVAQQSTHCARHDSRTSAIELLYRCADRRFRRCGIHAGRGACALARADGLLHVTDLFASGVLVATITFEMIPRALELGSLPIVIPGFIVGLAAVYALDLFVYRGQMAGEHSEKRRKVERFYTRRRPGMMKSPCLPEGPPPRS
jgi:hypothetical protein